MSSETDVPLHENTIAMGKVGIVTPLGADQIVALQPFLSDILSEVASALPGCRCTVQLFERPDEIQTVAASSVPYGILAGSSFPIGIGVAGVVAQTGVSLLVPDVTREPRFLTLHGEPSGALLCVAIEDGIARYGTLTAWSPALGALGGAPARTLLRLSAQATASMVTNSRRTRAIRTLVNTAARCDDPIDVIEQGMPLVQEVVAHRVCLAILGEATTVTVRTFEYYANAGDSFHHLREWALRVYDDQRVGKRPTETVAAGANGHMAYVVPLYIAEAFLGLACYFRSEPFTVSEQSVLEQCTYIVTTALSHANMLQRVRMERERFERAFSLMYDGLLLLDARGEIALYANPAFHTLTGISHIEAQFPLPVAALATHWRVDQQLDTHAEHSPLRHWYIKPEKHHDRIVEMIEAPLLIGDTAHRLRVFRPHAADSRMNSVQSEFMSVVSHELRSPLASVYGFLNLLTHEKAGPLTETQRDFLRAIHHSVRQLWRLVDDVCDLVQSDQKQIVLQLEEVDLFEVIRATVTSLMPLLESNEVRLDFEVEAPLPAVYVDPVRFHQILGNLLMNAMKFSEPGATISLRAYVSQGAIHIAVRDTGPGVAPEDIERIFERFVKGRNTSVRDASGLGLGLAVVRELVTLHGGRVWIENTPGGGSTFIFTVPIKVPSEA